MASEIDDNKHIVSQFTLGELFTDSLTNVPCVNVSSRRDVWVGMLMCAQYLESVTDSIVVRDDEFEPIGILGGYDLLYHLKNNPTRDSQYNTSLKDVMLKEFIKVEKNTPLRDMIEHWRKSGRAFSIIPNYYGDYSAISARKTLYVGMRCKSDLFFSSIPHKEILSIKGDESLGQILDIMYNNKTRKLLLENSDEYISDRLILGDISRMLHETKVEDFLEIPVNEFRKEKIHTIAEDIEFQSLCLLMEKMEHPYVRYKDKIVTLWDVCLTLLSEDLVLSEALIR